MKCYERTLLTIRSWTLAVSVVVATIIVLMRKLLYTWGVGLVEGHRISVARREKAKRRKRVAARRRKAAERKKSQTV